MMSKKTGPICIAILCAVLSGVLASSAEAKPPKEALDEETDLQLLDTPLRDAMSFVSDLHKVKVKIAEGIDVDTPITVKATKTKLGKALDSALKPHGLAVRAEAKQLVVEKLKRR